ncbi:MAG: hypothetical protein ACI311_07730 [Bacilli bacterium]
MKKSLKFALAGILCLPGILLLNSCGEEHEEPVHEHDISISWEKDENNHWHTCDGCDELFDKGAHVYDNVLDTTCNVCGYVRSAHVHDDVATWSKNETYHWHDCSTCGLEVDKAEHLWDEGVVDGELSLENLDKVFTCTVCGQTKTESASIHLNFVNDKDPNFEQNYVSFNVETAGSTLVFDYTPTKEGDFNNDFDAYDFIIKTSDISKLDSSKLTIKIYNNNKSQLSGANLSRRGIGIYYMASSISNTESYQDLLLKKENLYITITFEEVGEYEAIISHSCTGDSFEHAIQMSYYSSSFTYEKILPYNFNNNESHYYKFELTEEAITASGGANSISGIIVDRSEDTAISGKGIEFKLYDNEFNLIENTGAEETLFAENLLAGVYYIELISTSRINGGKISLSMC